MKRPRAKRKTTTAAKARGKGAARPTREPLASTPKAEVKITPAKGRPMLVWVGKRPLSRVTAFPAQSFETFDPTVSLANTPTLPQVWKDWPAAFPRGGLLFHGDSKEILADLLANGFRGAAKLIYIDPPFDSGADYVRRVSLRGAKGTSKIGGEAYTLGEQVQYADIWANDNYLQFMYERLLLLRQLLADDGALWLHCDWHRSHQLRVVAEEIFGQENLRNEIIWAYPGREMHIENKFNASTTLCF
jgi:adenine-specific DNA-methyltransferase